MCDHAVCAGLNTSGTPRPDTKGTVGDLTRDFTVQGYAGTSALLWQAPEAPRPNTPDHLPDRILRPFLEAEKAFSHGLWGAAAASYRKAVERGISPWIGKPEKTRMLGPRLGDLEKSGILPPAMLDWIRIVKDDGNFALHDDEHDFDTREQVEPAREFAFTLLTYLYSLPEKVRIARGLPEAAQTSDE